MLYIPRRVPNLEKNNFQSCFPKDLQESDPELRKKLQIISNSREKFNNWCSNSQKMADLNKETKDWEIHEILAYLDNATELMEMLCNKSAGPLTLVYQTTLTEGIDKISVSENPELIATAEIIMARLGIVFALLQNCGSSTACLSQNILKSKEDFTNNLKHCLTFVSHAGVRMAKLNHLKKYLLPVFGEGNHAYGAVNEFNWHILYGIYLLVEISYANLFL